MDRLPHAMVGAAPAHVRDLCMDIGIGRRWSLLEQGERAHDHARLAVPALRRVELLPRHLDRMGAIRGESFDGEDRLADGNRGWNAAGPDRTPVDVHSAGAALS